MSIRILASLALVACTSAPSLAAPSPPHAPHPPHVDPITRQTDKFNAKSPEQQAHFVYTHPHFCAEHPLADSPPC